MGINIPSELQWVAKYVCGAGDWPKGDETAMRRLSSAWSDLGTALADMHEHEAQPAATAALQA